MSVVEFECWNWSEITCVSVKHEYEWKEREKAVFSSSSSSSSSSRTPLYASGGDVFVVYVSSLFFYWRPLLADLLDRTNDTKRREGEEKKRRMRKREREKRTKQSRWRSYVYIVDREIHREERMTLHNVVLLIRKTSIFIKYTNLLQLPSFFFSSSEVGANVWRLKAIDNGVDVLWSLRLKRRTVLF